MILQFEQWPGDEEKGMILQFEQWPGDEEKGMILQFEVPQLSSLELRLSWKQQKEVMRTYKCVFI